jgi:SAM-dependent methyltransferase
MSAPPPLTDRSALARHRHRAGRQGAATFLHDLAADLIEERLAEVNRRFTEIAVVTGHPGVWGARFPEARIVGDEEILDLSPESHDLVIHALALHWANDPVGQLVQARRALRPDGLLLCVSFGGQTLYELRTALAEAEVALTGGLSPRVLPMGEIRDLGALLQRAGLALPVADSLTQVVTYGGLPALMRDLRAMGETNALSERVRRTPPKRLFEEAARVYSSAFPADGGRIPATFELVFLTGWAPAESQPKALRPGSARTRLADALGALELPAGDAVRRPRN